MFWNKKKKGQWQINKEETLRRAKEKGILTEGRELTDIWIDVINTYPQFKAKIITKEK